MRSLLSFDWLELAAYNAHVQWPTSLAVGFRFVMADTPVSSTIVKLLTFRSQFKMETC